MFACPHCGKTIEIGPQRESDGSLHQLVPGYKHRPGPRVELGCGSLIVIAIIVAIFSAMFSGQGGGSGGGIPARDVELLRQDVQAVGQKVDAIENSVKTLAAPEAAPGHNDS